MRRLTVAFSAFLILTLFSSGVVSSQEKTPIVENPFMKAKDGKLHFNVIGIDSFDKREVCISGGEGTPTVGDILNPRRENCRPIILTNYEVNKLQEGCKNHENWFGEKECEIIIPGVAAIRNAKAAEASDSTRRDLVAKLEALQANKSDPKELVWQKLIKERDERIRLADKEAAEASALTYRGIVSTLQNKEEISECSDDDCSKYFSGWVRPSSIHVTVKKSPTNLTVETWNTKGSGKKRSHDISLKYLDYIKRGGKVGH